MTKTDRITTAIIKLTSEQNDKIRAIACAQNKNETDVIEQLISQQLDLIAQQGPGHTRAEIQSIAKNSSLVKIMDPNRLWDETTIEGHQQWMTNEDNEPLLSEFSISSHLNSQCPYMEATFEQDRQKPHQWRAILIPLTQDIGELGDLPELLYPHASLYAAAEALHQAYTERHGLPNTSQAMRRTLQEILQNNQIQVEHGIVVYPRAVQDLHSEIDIDLLCQFLDDNLGEPDKTIEDYISATIQLQG